MTCTVRSGAQSCQWHLWVVQMLLGLMLSLSMTGCGASEAASPTINPATPLPGALSLVSQRYAGTGRLAPDPTLLSLTERGAGWTPDPAQADQDVPVYYSMGCQLGTGKAFPRTDCVLGDPDGPVRVAVVGDSKIGQWTGAIEDIGRPLGWRIEMYIMASCSFKEGPQTIKGNANACGRFVRRTLNLLKSPEHRPDIVILSGARGDAATSLGYVRSLAELQGTGARIVLIADNPMTDKTALATGDSTYECLAVLSDSDLCDFPFHDGVGTPALQYAAEHLSGVTLVNLNAWFCPGGEVCPAGLGGVVIYRHGSHVTNTFARSLAPVISRELYAAGIVPSVLPLAMPTGSHSP